MMAAKTPLPRLLCVWKYIQLLNLFAVVVVVFVLELKLVGCFFFFEVMLKMTLKRLPWRDVQPFRRLLQWDQPCRKQPREGDRIHQPRFG